MRPGARPAPRDQHLAIGQQRRRVVQCGRCSASRSPSRSRWPDRTAPRWQVAGCCRSPPRPAPCHWAATSPCARARPVVSEPVVPSTVSAGRIVQLRAGQSTDAVAMAPRDQHLAIGQQRRRVTSRVRCCSEPVARPRPGGRIVQLRAGKSAADMPSCPPRPAPCHWAATSPCDRRVRCAASRSRSTSRWPDRTAPRWPDSRCHSPPPATSTLPLGSNVAV